MEIVILKIQFTPIFFLFFSKYNFLTSLFIFKLAVIIFLTTWRPQKQALSTTFTIYQKQKSSPAPLLLVY